MNDSTTDTTGKVYLVGAGPGAVDLLTLRAVQCLGQADVVLYDYLANPQALEFAAAGAECICLGRHGHTKIWTQEEINARLIAEARAGRTVVRLKGGDPAIFARTAEEVDALTAAGVEFEIVAGVTAALAAGSYAGIPVTHRDLASAVAIVTGHEQGGKDESALDWSALAAFPGTLVVYMGATTAPRWSAALCEAGKPPATPAAIVRHCSRPDQLTIRCRLDEVASHLTGDKKIRPPVIVIIGPVTQLAETWNWFERRPLFGTSALVTRPAHQAGDLRDKLAELGAEVLVQPAIDITTPADWSPVEAALARLDEFDWLVFSSTNGVRYLLDRLLAGGRDLRALGGVRLAAVGAKTADELRKYNLIADVFPEEFRAEALAAALSADARGRRFLLARASRGREVLAEELTAAGGFVEQVVVYQSSDVTSPDEEIAQRLTAGQIDWVTVTSSAIAHALAAMFGDDLHKAKLASISPITTGTLKELGYSVDAEAVEYSMDGIVAAILQSRRNHF